MFLFQKKKRKKRKAHPQITSFITAHVPAEIWELTIDFVRIPATVRTTSNALLYPLLFVNSVFHHKAERELYRQIDLKDYPISQCVPRLMLFERLVNQSRLSDLVESFSNDVFSSDDIFVFGMELGQAYLTAFNRALRSLTRLHSLTFRQPTWKFYNFSRGISLDQMLDGCPFRLRSLTLPNWPLEGAPLVEAQQTDLQELTLNGPIEEAAYSPHAFPNLRVLTLGWVTIDIAPFLSGDQRRVSALHFDSGYKTSAGIRGGTFKSIRALRTVFAPASGVTMLAAALPSLRFIHLDVVAEQTDSSIREICDGLKPLRFLLKVVFCGTGLPRWQTPSDRQATATRVWSEIPSLESISFGCECWRRGDAGPSLLRNNMDEWKDPKWWT